MHNLILYFNEWGYLGGASVLTAITFSKLFNVFKQSQVRKKY